MGGVASGKSLAANMLVGLGAGLLDADRAGHAVLAEDDDVRNALRQRWGDAVFAPDGSVDRAAVAERVFAEGDEARADREFLEGLTHPRIRRRLHDLRDKHAAEDKPAAVLDAALLLEAGWNDIADIVVMIDAPREVRLARARRRGWTEAEFARREAAQWPVEQKRRLADAVISNDGTQEQLREAVRTFWNHHIDAGA